MTLQLKAQTRLRTSKLLLQSKQADITVGLCGTTKQTGSYAIALIAAERRLLWRAALFL
jgi:hypothetical protein